MHLPAMRYLGAAGLAPGSGVGAGAGVGGGAGGGGASGGGADSLLMQSEARNPAALSAVSWVASRLAPAYLSSSLAPSSPAFLAQSRLLQAQMASASFSAAFTA